MQLPDLSPWDIDPASATAVRPARGTNNDVRLIQTPSDTFVWRRYDNLSVQRVRAEHALLEWLAGRDLPFQVPRPLPTTDGATFAVLPGGRPAAVHRLLPGDRPADSTSGIALVATAFAHLSAALADAPLELAPIDWTRTRLTEIHEGIGDPDALLAALDEQSAPTEWLADTLRDESELHHAVNHLPRQLVHGDVAVSNALSDGSRITALLDFEIAGLDARVSDVGTALLTLGGDPGTEDGRHRIRLVRNAFDAVLHLGVDELDLLPEIVRRRLAGSTLWRAGRWRNGDATWDEVAHLRDGARHVRLLDAYRS